MVVPRQGCRSVNSRKLLARPRTPPRASSAARRHRLCFAKPPRGAYGIRTRAAAVRGRCPRPLDECAERFSVARAGHNRPMLGRWRKRREKQRANKQEGDVHALDREDDPRGGVQSDEYRTADPRDVVEEDGTVMAAPGGAPQENLSPEERRDQDRT